MTTSITGNFSLFIGTALATQKYKFIFLDGKLIDKSMIFYKLS
jgi:hypothetical protein